MICTSSAQGTGKPLKASQAVTDSSYLAPTSGSLNLNVIHCQVAMHSHRVRLTGVAFTVTSVCIRHYLLDNFMSHQSNEHSAKQQAQEPQIKQEPRIKGKFFESPSAVWVSHGDRLFKCAPESLRPASMREWSQAGPLRFPSELTEGPQGDRSTFEISPPDYSPTTVAPDEETEQEVNPEATPVVTPQSSLQPEMEAIPAVDVPVSETSLNTPSVEPHQPLGAEMEPFDLDSDTSVNPTNSEEQVLLCSPLDPQDFNDLLDCSVLQPGEPDCRILLAEDGLPFHEHPKTCQVDECFSLQIELNESDIQKWNQSEKPEALIHVASVAKRSRSEVQVKNLSLEDRFLFDKAKDAELNYWLQTSALKPILRKHLNPD